MGWNDGLEEGTPAFILASTDSKTIRAVAGPGSGKSFAIKRRIARLLELGVNPERILAITFTRTAAQDLKREINSLGIAGADMVHSRTLHSHALKILMQTDVLERTGRVPRMVIDHEIMPALKDINDSRYGGLREKKKLLEKYLAAWATLQSDSPGFVKQEVDQYFERDIVHWLRLHEGILVGEVIPVAIDFLRSNPAFPEIGKYEVVLVDEYQDLNRSEQEFIKLIRGNSSIVIVGDDDQSIYGFKFAHPDGIREVEKLYGDYQDIPFSECRRCPIQVTRMASRLISTNPHRTLGDLVPHAHNQDGIVQIIQWGSYNEEIEGISRIILSEVAKGTLQPQDVLVLCPRRRIGYKLRDILIMNGLPTKSYFRESAITKEVVKRAYSMMNLLANPSDAISLRYLLGHGSTDFRRLQYKRLKSLATENKISIREVLDQVLAGKISIIRLRTITNHYRTLLSDMMSFKNNILSDPENAFSQTFIKNEEDEIEFYELNQLYTAAVSEVGTEALADPDKLEEWIKEVFGNIQENITLPESPSDIDHVRIMSLHSSKGLSAKFVILCSMIDHLIPFTPDDMAAEDFDHTVEEQRRLFYVAMTRCKSSNDYPGRLVISSFLSIPGTDAVRMGLKASAKSTLSVSATRYLRDFNETAPAAILGDSILE